MAHPALDLANVNVNIHLHMNKTLPGIITATSTFLAAASQAQSRPALYDQAVAILRERYFDKDFRENKLDERRSAIAAAPPRRKA